tara:strand:- start:70 stop:270 length:201 start_codon:yes stop_codon:yes gene_type:complete
LKLRKYLEKINYNCRIMKNIFTSDRTKYLITLTVIAILIAFASRNIIRDPKDCLPLKNIELTSSNN